MLLVASDHGGQQKRLHYPLAAETTWNVASPLCGSSLDMIDPVLLSSFAGRNKTCSGTRV
jgi:hypothetical protein